MRKIKNADAERLIKKIIPKEILEIKPIIAGGFVTALYSGLISRQNNNDYMKLIELFQENNISERDLVGYAIRFGDIDLWFTNNHPIRDSEHPNSFLIEELYTDKDISSKISEEAATVPPLKISFSEISKYSDNIYFSTTELYKEKLANLGIYPTILNSSSWANTFYIANNYIKIQFIKTPYEDIESIFSKFDIANCRAAYYDGEFYFGDDFEDSMNSKILMEGVKFKQGNILRDLISAERAFKYAERYNLEFSKNIYDSIIKTFVESDIVAENIKKGNYIITIQKETPEGDIVDAYQRDLGDISSYTVQKMIEDLSKNFHKLLTMKEFREEDLFLFLRSKNSYIANVVKVYFARRQAVLDQRINNIPFTEAKQVFWGEEYKGLYI